MAEGQHTDYYQRQWEVLVANHNKWGLLWRLGVGVVLSGVVMTGLWLVELNMGIVNAAVLGVVGSLMMASISVGVFFWQIIMAKQKHQLMQFRLSLVGLQVNSRLVGWDQVDREKLAAALGNEWGGLLKSENNHEIFSLPLRKGSVAVWMEVEDRDRVVEAIRHYVGV